jgi:hypothetical protein
MKENIIKEVSDILSSFDINEISKLIQDQINSDYTSEPSTDIITDHFRPLYASYAREMSNDYPNEVQEEVESYFMSICELFLNAMCEKFHLSINQEWKDDNYKNIPGITMALYSFFVLDFSTNVYDVILNYILRNTKNIYKTFEGMKNKKDASTIVNRKSLSPEFCVIASNIYDIAAWILQQLSDEDFVSYMNQDYLPLKLIRGLISEGYLGGDFVEVICDIFTYCVTFRSNICFTIISKIRTGEIADPYEKVETE